MNHTESLDRLRRGLEFGEFWSMSNRRSGDEEAGSEREKKSFIQVLGVLRLWHSGFDLGHS